MLRKWKDRCMENRKLCICAIVAIAVLLVIVLFICFHVSWKKGGTDTKGPFRYGRCHNGSYEVRIDTTNLPKGTFVVQEDGAGATKTKEKGKKGNEQRYRIRINGDYGASWQIFLYADKQAEKNNEYLYLLEFRFHKDENGKMQVLYAQAQDVAPVCRFTEGDYDISYQLSAVKKSKDDGNIQGVSVKIENSPSDEWEASYDKKLLNVTDFFYDLGTVSTSIAAADGQKGSFQTDVCLYTVKVSDQGTSHGTEIVLHVKGKDGVITGVTHEQ